MRLITLLLLVGVFSRTTAQPCLPLPIDTVYSGECAFIPQVPAIPAGIMVTRCFTIYSETDYITPGFILIQSSSCGPIAYSSLSYVVYNTDCDSLVAQGSIFPVPVNPTPYIGNENWYQLCLTWMPLCSQTAVCPNFTFSPLPVELLRFEGMRSPGGIRLEWETATESNSSHYEIERGSSIEDWKKIARVEAAGFSQSRLEYAWTDLDPYLGVNYYRLIQYDLNGQLEIFKMIAVYYDREDGAHPLRGFNLLGQRAPSFTK